MAMNSELIDFMIREFGSEGPSILKSELTNSGISNLDSAPSDVRKQFATNLKGMLPYHSLSKTNVVFSELLTILRLDVLNYGSDKFGDTSTKLTDDEYEKILEEAKVFYNSSGRRTPEQEKELYLKFVTYKQNKILQHFWTDIDKSLTKFEIIFNLFWLKAGEAELRGLDHTQVVEITNKALFGIKSDLEQSYHDLLAKFDIVEAELEEKSIFTFHLSKQPDIDRKMDDKKERNRKKKIAVKRAIEKFWSQVNQSYKSFKQVFIESLNDEVATKKAGNDDSMLIIETQQKMIKIWGDIEKSYFILQDDLVVIQKTNLN